MNKEMKEILKEIECYQNEDMCIIMLSQKENKALLDYITNLQQENDNMEKIIKQNKYKKRILELEEARSFLQQENERLKDEVNDITNISYKDYNVWLTERHYLDTLDEFANDIKYKIAPNLTDTYRDGIKSALKHTIKYVKDNYKQETLEDCKSRCEKAVEYINKNKHLSMFADCRDPEEDWNYDLECSANDLLNILQNGSEDK